MSEKALTPKRPVSLEKQPLKTLIIVWPDEASGKAFTEAVKGKISADAEVKIININKEGEIAPRVVEGPEGKGVMNEPELVAEGLAAGIIDGLEQAGAEKLAITIACNTASLPVFIKPAVKIVEKKKGWCEGSDYKLITTIGAIKEKYTEARELDQPVFLGTSVICRALPSNEFDTLHHRGQLKAQNLLQELIWRVKAVEGSDTKTAPEAIKENIGDKNVLAKKIREFLEILENLEIRNVILGCTELPILFEKWIPEFGIQHNLQCQDPAEIVAEKFLAS